MAKKNDPKRQKLIEQIRKNDSDNSENKTFLRKTSTWWNGFGVIAASTLSIAAIVISLLVYLQTQENNKQLDIQRIKDNAERYFDKEKYCDAFREYEKLKKLDPTDSSGYYNFVNEAKRILLSDFPNCQDSRKYYYDYARKLYDCSEKEIDSLLMDKCK